MKAVVIGATGLVGGEIVKCLIENDQFDKILIFVRRPTGLNHEKVEEKIVNFDNLQEWGHEVRGDVLFSALGTTIKTAGSQMAQRKVDFDYQFEIANWAKKNGVGSFILISSTGANKNSPFFYLRLKGELELVIERLDFDHFLVLRPGPLKGKRERPRRGEIMSQFFFSKLPNLKFFATLLPVDAKVVAWNAIKLACECFEKTKILEAYEIHSSNPLAK
jgi:uncharacterized protein YbjT (DUF2867 family)